MKGNYPHIFEPLVIRGNVLKNRLESANSMPHFLQGPELYPAQGVITHLANRAKSGAAVVSVSALTAAQAVKH